MNDLEPGKVGQPQLIGCFGWMRELILCCYNRVYRAGYEIIGLQYPVHGRF